MFWIHKKCSGTTKRLVGDENYVYPRCKGEYWPIHGQTVTEVDVNGTLLEVEATFCYLGDMLCSGGRCDSAIVARCVAYEFRKLYGSKTWGPLITLNCSGSAAMTMPWMVSMCED